MIIKEFLHYASDILKSEDIETPVLEAGVMLCYVLNCDRTYLFAHDDRVLNEEELVKLKNMLDLRSNKVPLQYIIGYTEFMSLDFTVSPAVLIPRQDTEVLVEKCIDLVRQKQKTTDVSVLDMCTGSGCIGISIAHYCPECKVVACDISEEALKIAKKNSERNGTENRLRLFQGDLFEALGKSEYKFDIIVSNPPYIESDTILKLQKQVKDNEPLIALDGGKDGLVFYKRIIERAPEYLNKNSYLALEIGYNQAQDVTSLMQSKFEDIAIYKDLGGNDRVAVGRVIEPD